ncbi:MAG: ATP-binding cassette domain-containing protein [Deltaproteobacteria bacterium]|nr:ATP-binding cassette domain-containing protein [Deltaproteobacteria bacterium]MBW2419767.1 ATP-binding cassette domain-containing protein [Deltaproteobacteria bacterium]
MTTASGATSSILPLELRDVSYGVREQLLLKAIRLRLEAGGMSVILGPNGAGKSLTLRLAHGLIEPTSGRVCWLGAGAAEAALRQAMVFERPVLLRRSAAANVDYALALHGVGRAARRLRVAEVLEKTGLAAIAQRPARVLSAGEQQRLTLARAWALSPEVLFLDEPTAALDPTATRSVEAIIENIAASGTKIVMTTHDLGQARRLADEVVFLARGELLEHTPAAEFFEAPRSAEAQAFLKGELLW